MADVVGTAFVRIKALTNDLAKDIQKGTTKAAKDADVDSSGEIIGDDLVKGIGKSLNDKLGGVVSDSTKHIDKDVDVDSGRRLGDRLAEGIKDGFSKAMDSNIFKSVSGRITKLMGLDEEDGGKKGQKFGRGLLGAIAKFSVLFSPAVLGLGSLLLQYVVALTAQIGLLAVAAVGAGVALGAVFGAAALGALPLFLAFKANTAELAAFKEVATGVADAWKEVGAATQETLLPGLTRALELSKEAIPVFRGFGREIGRVASAFAEMAVGEFVGDQDRLRNILQASARIFASLAGFARNFVSIFLDLFESALPIGEQFAEALKLMSDRWVLLIRAGNDSGTLAATFQDWYDKAVLVGGALSDLFAAIWNILTVGSDSAVPFFDNFATWAAGFRAFTESAAGQNKLKQIFDDALGVAHEFNGLVVDIFNVIGGQVFDAGGNDGIIGFIRVLREDFVPLLDGLATNLKGEYGPALSDFFDVFGEFITQLARADGLKIILETLTATLEAFTIALETLMKIPGFESFLGFLIGIGGSLKVIGGAFGLLKKTGAVSLLSGLVTAVGFLAGGFANLFAGGTFFAGLGGAIVGGGAAVALGGVVAALAAVAAAVGAVVLIWKNWDTIVRFIKDPMERLTALKENIENLVGTIRDKLGKALGAAGRALASLGGTIRDKIGSAIETAIEVLSKIPGFVGRALLKLGAAVVGAFAKAIKALVTALPRLVLKLIEFWAALPFRIAFALAGLSKAILEVFIETFIEVGAWIVQTGIPAVVRFFSELPGKIVRALSSLKDLIVEVFAKAFKFILSLFTTEGPKILQFFRDLPGKIVSALSTLAGAVGGAFRTAFDAAKTAISDFITKTLPAFGSDMLAAGSNLIGQLVSGLGKVIGGTSSIAKNIVNGIIDFLNREVFDKFNDLIEIDIGKGPLRIKIDPPDVSIPRLSANGDIFRKATNIIAGEAGAEVLIPLTRPRRALELFNQSGLARVLSKAGTPLPVSAGVSSTGAGSGASPIDASGWTIVSPTPEETARQMVSRLRTVAFLSGVG